MKHADAPIKRHEDDQLGRKDLIAHLTRMLIAGSGEKRRATCLSVGLTGPWGSGKSSVLRLLAEHLASLANVVVIEFNPWIFQGRDDLLEAFFEELSSQLGQSGGDVRALLKALDKYRDAIEPAVAATFPGAQLFAKFLPHRTAPSALARRRNLENRLSKLKGAVVVLIDELDRVEPEEIRVMARLIKAIGDLPNISYLISYDRSRVETALGSGDEQAGAAYLEKIVQFPVPLRPLVTDEVTDLLAEALIKAGYGPTLGDPSLMDALLERLVPLIDTPRDVKRLVSSFAAVEPMVRSEVHAVDVLAYSAICAKAAAFRDILARDLDAVVNDPTDILIRIRRREAENRPTVEGVFGASVDPLMERLLTFLFPALDKSQKPDEERFGRLQERRNLMTMLYLGDPPFQVSRKEIEGFWKQPAPELLESRRADGTLGDFTGQLYRLMPQLPAEGDMAAWKELAKETGRGSGSFRVSGRHIASNLRSTLVEFASRGDAERLRVVAIVAALIKGKDLALVPDIVRYHMFAHGLVPTTPAREGPTIFDLDQTRALLTRELKRYRNIVLSGQWLSGRQDSALVFALQQGGEWTTELRMEAEKAIDRSSCGC